MSQSEPKPNQAGPEDAPDPHRICRAEETSASLQPKQPPGLKSRKVRRFGDRIRQLHAEGYSLETIRETLSEAGVIVSKSTVQREAARRPTPPAPALMATAAQQPTQLPRPVHTRARAAKDNAPASRAAAQPAAPTRQSGKDIAEAFFDSHSSNPLFRKDKR